MEVRSLLSSFDLAAYLILLLERWLERLMLMLMFPIIDRLWPPMSLLPELFISH